MEVLNSVFASLSFEILKSPPPRGKVSFCQGTCLRFFKVFFNSCVMPVCVGGGVGGSVGKMIMEY